MTNRQKITILCVDDHRLVREGIALIIGQQPDMKVVALAGTGEEAVLQYRKYRPDITLMDLRLESMSGPDAIRAIRRESPDARIIALTMYQGDEDIHQALAAGASTYLLKNSLSDDLIGVVRQVHAGERPLPPAVKARLDERAQLSALTPREIEVLSLIAQGNRNKEVADLLGISITTVPGHLRKVFQKLGVNERTAAVKVAVRRGIIRLD